jgi:uncharacterized protein (TIGR02145 family)
VPNSSGTGSVTMTCTASGGSGGSYLYKWYSGTACTGIVLGTNPTLPVTESGNYSCKVYINGCSESTYYGCDYGTATVTPSCSSPTSNVPNSSGTGSVTMTCTASGGSGGSYLYKWYSGTACTGIVLGTNSTLPVTESGNYSCKVYINGCSESTYYGCDYGTATVTPSCSSPTSNVPNSSGTGSVTMTCTASGGSGGSYLYKWYSGTACTGIVLGTNSTLPVTESGNYSCKVYINGCSESTYYDCDYGTATVTLPPIVFNPNLSYGTVSDIEGNIYKTIQIGTQNWMAENLRTIKYNDGNSIPNVTDNDIWYGFESAAYCWYNNDGAIHKDIYGALYNYYTVNTSKLCPTGWHVPSDEEWTTLTTYLGGVNVAGGKLKETGTTHWNSPNSGATNESGFTALPGGSRYIGIGLFSDYEVRSSWWSATLPFLRLIWFDQITLDRLTFGSPSYGFSVRCVQDDISTLINTTSTSSIKIFPNPVSSFLSIEYNNENENNLSINILNSQGKILVKEKVILPMQQIDFSKYSTGFYILEFINSTGKTQRIKILKY